MGKWLGENGYSTAHIGKWHVPGRELLDSFDLVYSHSRQGEYGDRAVAREAEAYLHNYKGSNPFFMVVGFLQPHDICFWAQQHLRHSESPLYPEIEDKLPPLPPNFNYDPREPQQVKENRLELSEIQWRYYIWAYYRHVEMADAVVGHVLNALEDSGYANDTIVIFSSDHGDGHGRHRKMFKNVLYDEVVKVPLVFSCPGRIIENRQDTVHLVSGVDLAPTLCDLAGVAPLPDQCGRSLKPLLADDPTEWREFVIAEDSLGGRMIRTPDFKCITYENDSVHQLFDIRKDPWETTNLAEEERYASIVNEHLALHDEWEKALKPVSVV